MKLIDTYTVELLHAADLPALLQVVKQVTTNIQVTAMKDSLKGLADLIQSRHGEAAYGNLVDLLTVTDASDDVAKAREVEENRLVESGKGLIVVARGTGEALYEVVDEERKLIRLLEGTPVDAFMTIYYRKYGNDKGLMEWDTEAVFDEKGKILYMQTEPKLRIQGRQIMANVERQEIKTHSVIGSVLDDPDRDMTDVLFACHRPTIPLAGLNTSSDVADYSETCPNIGNFFACMSDPKALAAWIYGHYSGRYLGRQVPWITSKALHGKSLICNAIFENLFASAYASQGSRDVKQANNFSGSMFTELKIASIPDCEIPHLLTMEWVKSVTGDDKVRIEIKGKTPYSVRLEVKPIVMSNKDPIFGRDEAAVSRAMPLYMVSKPVFKGFKPVEEMPHFLDYAKACYEEVISCGQTGKQVGYREDVITLNALSKEYVEKCIICHEREYITFAECLTFQEGGELKHQALCDLYRGKDRYFMDNFIRWIIDYKGVKWADNSATLLIGVEESRGVAPMANPNSKFKLKEVK